MKLITKFLAVGLVAGMATTAFAADHRDGATAVADPTSDINDLFTFPDGNNMVFGMTVFPFADATTSKFSNTVKYAFHTSSYASPITVADITGAGTATGSEDIICTFTTAQVVSCWVGTKDYVTGDASGDAGITSADGKLKVFAGPRADPFFFYLTGFNNARNAVIAAVPTLALYPSGCPKLDAATVTLLQTALTTNVQSQNNFVGANGLALVVEVDKTLVTANADEAISVWASTNN